MIVMIPNLEHPYWSSVSSSVTATARNAQSKRLGHSDNSVLLRCMGFCDEGTAPAEKEEPHKGGLWTTNAIQFIEYVGLCPSLCPVAHCSLLDSRDRSFVQQFSSAFLLFSLCPLPYMFGWMLFLISYRKYEEWPFMIPYLWRDINPTIGAGKLPVNADFPMRNLRRLFPFRFRARCSRSKSTFGIKIWSCIILRR